MSLRDGRRPLSTATMEIRMAKGKARCSHTMSRSKFGRSTRNMEIGDEMRVEDVLVFTIVEEGTFA